MNVRIHRAYCSWCLLQVDGRIVGLYPTAAAAKADWADLLGRHVDWVGDGDDWTAVPTTTQMA